MGIFEENMSDKDSMGWVVAGFVTMILGIFVFVSNKYGVFLSLVGVFAFLAGYYRWNPTRALTGGR
jgi:hypothetical protein